MQVEVQKHMDGIDSDNDGVPDEKDEDDDNDGVPDEEDEDDNNDGVPDEENFNYGFPDAAEYDADATSYEDEHEDCVPDEEKEKSVLVSVEESDIDTRIWMVVLVFASVALLLIVVILVTMMVILSWMLMRMILMTKVMENSMDLIQRRDPYPTYIA